jgi:hypothetical protein
MLASGSRAQLYVDGEGRRRVELLLLISCKLRDAVVCRSLGLLQNMVDARFNPQTLLCLKTNQQLGGTQQL